MLTDEIRKFIGFETEVVEACDPVERGAVRRFAQAVMDRDRIYMDGDYTRSTRYEAPVAPPLFALSMLRSEFTAPDLLTERARDPDYDGLEDGTLGLPALPLSNSPLLNGGTEVEILRLPSHGERVRVKSRYRDIYERQTSKGNMMFVIIETDFLGADGDVICRARKTQIRREGKPK
jgi:acyl dehydratase